MLVSKYNYSSYWTKSWEPPEHWTEILRQASKGKLSSAGKQYFLMAKPPALTLKRRFWQVNVSFFFRTLRGSHPSWTLKQCALWRQQGTAPHRHGPHSFLSFRDAGQNKRKVFPGLGTALTEDLHVCDTWGCPGSRKLSFEYRYNKHLICTTGDMMKNNDGSSTYVPCILHLILTTPLGNYYFIDKEKIKSEETGAGMWTRAVDF